jgi:hypothetical protein
MPEMQKFPISNFRTGLDQAVEPWLLPRDAYQSVLNAHLYRGVLEKIGGYLLFAKFSNRNQLDLGTPDGVTKIFTGNITQPTSSNFFGYGTITIGTAAETFTYSGESGNIINLAGSNGGTGTVDLGTLIVTLNFFVAPPLSPYSCVLFQWDAAPSVKTAIMGIKQYYAKDGSQKVVVFDQHRAGIIVENLGILGQPPQAIQAISEIPHDYYQSNVFTAAGAVTAYQSGVNAIALTANTTPGTIRFSQFTAAGVPDPVFSITNPFGNIISDNSMGGLFGNNVNSLTSFVNYSTGAYIINFLVPPTATNRFDATSGVFGDIFHGSFSNFFTTNNYVDCLFLTNSIDPVMYYDGTTLHYLLTFTTPTLVISSAGVPTNLSITTALHLTTYYDRLLLIAPTYLLDGIEDSLVAWSKLFNPFDFTQNFFLDAPTSQPIRAFGYINTDLVIRFASSERVFRYVGDEFKPFRWDSTNNMWDCDAPYSTISYDTWFSTIGKPAIVGSDGVNVKRVDEIIPDFTDSTILAQQTTLPFMSQTSIRQCYGERFDSQKEGWLCYPSAQVDLNNIEGSDHVLSFNYIDSTYAIYEFPFSCLGLGLITTGQTWGETLTDWVDTAYTWGSYLIQKNTQVDLAGDQYDNVYVLEEGNQRTVAGDSTCTPYPVLFDVTTKNFNPFGEDGQKATFCYVDFLVSAYNASTLRVQFFVNDQMYLDGAGVIQGYYKEEMLTFTETDDMSPSTNQTKVWKRIYVNAVGKFHTMRLYQAYEDLAANPEQPIYIHSMVLYMAPAGPTFT